MDGDSQQAVQNAYLAGIFDGDSTMGIRMYVSKQKQTYYHPFIGIQKSNNESIDYICKFLPLSKCKERVCANRRVIYRCQVSNVKDCLHIVNTILPYLIVKRNHAIVLKQFCEGIKSQKRQSIDEHELQRRQDLYMKCKKLNDFGAAATTESKGRESVSNSLDLGESLGGESEEVCPLS